MTQSSCQMSITLGWQTVPEDIDTLSYD